MSTSAPSTSWASSSSGRAPTRATPYCPRGRSRPRRETADVAGPRLALASALVLLALVLQLSILPLLNLPGATPDLVLLCVVGLALAAGPMTGTGVGFAAGLAL